MTQVQRVCDDMSLPFSVNDKAIALLAAMRKKTSKRVSNLDAMAGAAVYLACEAANAPRPIREVPSPPAQSLLPRCESCALVSRNVLPNPTLAHPDPYLCCD
jgi:hypothetical protein